MVIENGIDYYLKTAKPVIQGKVESIMVKPQAHDLWFKTIQSDLKESVFGTPFGGCFAWYSNEKVISTTHAWSQMHFCPHRTPSHYVPQIKEIPKDVSQYVILKRFGSGNKIFDVFDTEKGKYPIGSNNPNDRLFYFHRSRAVKGAYRMFKDDKDPMCYLRAGLRGNVCLIKADVPVAELGWHIINHRVDAIDSYRMFTLSDGYTYQWTYRGQWLEKIHNLGEKESEIRERIGQVTFNGPYGFTLYIDESKMYKEIALTTALISFIDQWSTNLEIGGIYYAKQHENVRWKRD
ncbi:unnamed protein product [Candida verbasci]|uniref:Uncharacterized protein n=1 Tax=Candida verbasci TaxID=1227364 RepID=A0A9W4X8Y6_9ASCO|nr:unnamed protein product [Candida verbasci]